MKTKSSKHHIEEELTDEVFEMDDINNLEDENEESEELKVKQEDYKTISADDSVKVYLQQIGKIPLLSFEEELKVAKRN